MKNDLTQARLKELFHFDPEVGIFVNITSRHPSSPKGKIAGNRTCNGYVEIGVDRHSYLAHRLAWLYMTGNWPSDNIDHKDGNRSNNAFSNLRDVPQVINCQNMRIASKANSTGLLGAYRVGNRFKTSIKLDGHLMHIGYFDTAKAAHEAYLSAKRRLHDGCTI